MTKASELADELIECPMEELCHHSQEAAALLRKQEAVIRQMREALRKQRPPSDHPMEWNPKLHAAIAAADGVLGDQSVIQHLPSDDTEGGGRCRFRTCDPHSVNVVLYP